MTSVVKLEGQTIPIDDAIAASDALVKKALMPFYPEIVNATISRTEKDGLTTVTVIKRAGTKGSIPLQKLIEAPESVNSAIALSWELKRLEAQGEFDDVTSLLKYHHQIDNAIKQGEDDAANVDYSLKKLKIATAQPSSLTVWGF